MNRFLLTIAALLAFAAAGCAKDSSKEAAPTTSGAAAAPAAEAKPAEAAAPADTNAAAPAESNAAAPAEGNAAAPAPAPETAAAEPTPPPPQTPQQMMRDIRNGGHAVNPCTKIDEVTTAGFDQCVDSALAAAQAKGQVSDAYQLGVNYRAWSYMGEHIAGMREKGMEWSKGYRMANESRENYRKAAAGLLDKTGLAEKQVCPASGVPDCPGK